MIKKRERSIPELYRNDPERADALVFGRVVHVGRRGFLDGAGLAAMGVARHNMMEIEGKERELVLDCLAEHYPPRAPRQQGDWRNPFLAN